MSDNSKPKQQSVEEQLKNVGKAMLKASMRPREVDEAAVNALFEEHPDPNRPQEKSA